jgi:multiple sugar transport system permease protein
MKRSLIVALSSTFFACALGIPAGYGLARFDFRRKDDIAFWILSTRFLPPIAALIPFLVIWLTLNMFDTYATLIVMHLVLNLPLVVWLSSKFLKEIPVEIEEAARVDGCSRLLALVRIVLPQAGPGLAVAAIFAFVFSWNEFFFAFVLTSTKTTLPVVISGFLAHGHEIKWGPLASAAIIASSPALVLVIVARKIMAKGFTQMIAD